MADLTDFELRLFEWIRQSDFETVAWSTKSAAKSFKCKEDEIYDGVASLTKKLYIASSGIIVNFLLAWIILFSIFAFYGIDQPTLQISTIGNSSVSQNEPAPSYIAGLQPGDIIYTFNGQSVDTWDNLVSLIEVNPNQEVNIGYSRNSQNYITTAKLEARDINNQSYGYLGVSPVLERQTLSILEAVPATTFFIFAFCVSIL